MSSLFKAAEENIDALEAAVRRGDRIDDQTVAGRTALIIASRNGKLEAVKFLIEQKATIDDSGQTALLWSCSHGRLQVAEFLLYNKKLMSTRSPTEGGIPCSLPHSEEAKSWPNF